MVKTKYTTQSCLLLYIFTTGKALVLTIRQVEDRVRAFCGDGGDFIKQAIKMAWDDPFPDLGPIKSASQRAREARMRKGQQSPLLEKGSRRVSHFIMNLPDSAISFLGSYRGLFKELKDDPEFEKVYEEFPIVHCYCFTRELEEENAKKDILQVSLHSLGNFRKLTSFE